MPDDVKEEPIVEDVTKQDEKDDPGENHLRCLPLDKVQELSYLGEHMSPQSKASPRFKGLSEHTRELVSTR